MRKKLNLNKHYEGLPMEAVNELFSRMVDLKTNIDGLNYIYNESEERFEKTERWEHARSIGEGGIHFQAKKIDILMGEHNKETVFGTTRDMMLTEEDYRRIIAQYRYLMSEPEEEQDGVKC